MRDPDPLNLKSTLTYCPMCEGRGKQYATRPMPPLVRCLPEATPPHPSNRCFDQIIIDCPNCEGSGLVYQLKPVL